MKLEYDLNRQYVELADPTWEEVARAIMAINGGRLSPSRRGLLLLSEEGLLTIDGLLELNEERVLLRYKRHPQNRHDYPPYAKLLDPILPATEDDATLIAVVSLSNEVEDVHKYETVPK